MVLGQLSDSQATLTTYLQFTPQTTPSNLAGEYIRSATGPKALRCTLVTALNKTLGGLLFL